MNPAVAAVANRYRARWRVEKMALDRLVAGAAADHSSLPDNYWVPERAARAKLAIAEALAEAFDE